MFWQTVGAALIHLFAFGCLAFMALSLTTAYLLWKKARRLGNTKGGYYAAQDAIFYCFISVIFMGCAVAVLWIGWTEIWG